MQITAVSNDNETLSFVQTRLINILAAIFCVYRLFVKMSSGTIFSATSVSILKCYIQHLRMYFNNGERDLNILIYFQVVTVV